MTERRARRSSQFRNDFSEVLLLLAKSHRDKFGLIKWRRKALAEKLGIVGVHPSAIGELRQKLRPERQPRARAHPRTNEDNESAGTRFVRKVLTGAHQFWSHGIPRWDAGDGTTSRPLRGGEVRRAIGHQGEVNSQASSRRFSDQSFVNALHEPAACQVCSPFTGAEHRNSDERPLARRTAALQLLSVGTKCMEELV